MKSSALHYLTPNLSRSSLWDRAAPRPLAPKGTALAAIQPDRGASSTHSLQPQNCRETTQHHLDVSSSLGRKTEQEGRKMLRGRRPGVGQGSGALAMGPAGLTPHDFLPSLFLFALPWQPSSPSSSTPALLPSPWRFGGLFSPPQPPILLLTLIFPLMPTSAPIPRGSQH